MSNSLIAPTNLYIFGIALITVLVIVSGLSVYYYCKAKDIAPFLIRLEDLLRKIAEAQNTLEETKQEFRNTLDECAQADRIIADGKAAKGWLEQNGSKVEALKEAVDKSKQKLKDADDAYQKRQEELDKLSQQVADKNVEIMVATEKKNAMEIETARLTDEFASLKISIKRKEQQEQTLTEKIIVLQKQEHDLSAKVKDLEQRYDTLKQQLKEHKEELNRTSQQLQNEKGELAEVQGQKNAVKTILAEAKETQKMNDDRWGDLDRPYIPTAKTLAVSNRNEHEWLEEFTCALDEYGFKFNDRTVRAFHTGLKCGERSPLVVLSGISGTGKSLLPELYAAALGMNFLPVAVQPRWDSPQDLFGFYNYMEGRYKATELSRLLWQFDKYNNGEATSLYKNQMPMNLVLLDEMNIARVEYYFSDLLSKLEFRQGLNPDNAENRWKAEIELECNASAENKQTRRLFVALNTLFIGTMNEDESTQTLSDKVIDRSNVLRFGRPQKLDVAPDKDGFLKYWASSGNITHQNWQQWCKLELAPQDCIRLRQELQRINETLDNVDKPFGLRVNHAIEKYVACYPGAFNVALADQIEMKILPKMNGLEKDMQEFVTIKQVLDEIIGSLNDKGLSETFAESCRDSHNSFFKWRGITR